MAAASAAELEGRCAVPEEGEQPPYDEGAVDSGEGVGGGAAGGAAERLGVFQAGRLPRHIVEHGFRRGRCRGSGYEPGRESDDAVEVVDCGICSAVRGAHDLCLRGVPQEASAEASGFRVSGWCAGELGGKKSGEHWLNLPEGFGGGRGQWKL